MPTRAIINVNKPKAAVSKDTFSPPAKTEGSGFPMASTESNAVIKPITDPKKPSTKPNKLESTVSFSILLDITLFIFILRKPLTKKKTESKRQIKISVIKKDPPSANRSAN